MFAARAEGFLCRLPGLVRPLPRCPRGRAATSDAELEQAGDDGRGWLPGSLPRLLQPRRCGRGAAFGGRRGLAFCGGPSLAFGVAWLFGGGGPRGLAPITFDGTGADLLQAAGGERRRRLAPITFDGTGADPLEAAGGERRRRLALSGTGAELEAAGGERRRCLALTSFDTMGRGWGAPTARARGADRGLRDEEFADHHVLP